MLQRNRTLTGCGTCRSRHVKCDETRPVCQNCQQQNITCLGFERQLSWAKGNSHHDADRVYRRPLFSVSDQQRMTRMTVDSLGYQSASNALAKLDFENGGGGRASPCLEHDSFQGPFGVLSLPGEQASRDCQSESQPYRAEISQLDLDLLWNSLDGAPVTGETPLLGGLYDLAEESRVASGSDPLLDVDTMPNDLQILLSGSLDTISDEIICRPTSLPSTLVPSHALQLAPDLLRHFQENIASLSFPLKNCRKCPWQAIHLPSAMSTFAELTIHQKASHTRLSLFYSLLAASCLHKYARDQSAVALDTPGKIFKETAKQHLELAIQEEVSGPKRAKYKEILMAILSMVMLSVFHGENSDAQAFLVDAEYLIRIRGLPKPHKSVKVRSLHHVYTYLRIMAESTCGCALLNICPDRPSSNLLLEESSQICLRSFRVAHDSLGAEIDMKLEKSSKIGHNDIHLEVMGTWKDTLYPDIYGIPESLMSLLSQVIRLANEQELLHRGPTLDVRVAEELKQRAITLEQCILSWEPPTNSLPFSADQSAMEDGQISQSQAADFMVQAMHHALILFYYRRVPKISVLILQDTVRKCLDFLVRSDNARVETASPDMTILWPGFVAACEAVDPDLQEGLLDWLVATGHRTSLGSFSGAAGTAQCVWKARKEAKDYTLGWFDVMKHERCPIIVT